MRSPHVVQMLDHGLTAGGQPYIAMELLEGESLRARLDRDAVLAPKDVITVVAHCAKALEKAHGRGVVHRDIKPDNIFVTDSGGDLFVKVLDFGIAKAIDDGLAATRTGAVLGSPYYMSPEQVVGAKSLDSGTDLWSLGIVAFEALTGRRPFDGETIGALSIAVCHGELPVPSRIAPELAAVDAWFARACARDRAARFPNAREMSDALAAALANAPRKLSARPPALAATMPLSTTAGLGVRSSLMGESSAPAPRWKAFAAAGGIVLVGAGLGVWFATRSAPTTVVAPATAAADAPSKDTATATAATVVELQEPAASVQPPPAGTAPAGTPNSPTAVVSAASAKVSEAPAANPKGTPKAPSAVKPPPHATNAVPHEPNIF